MGALVEPHIGKDGPVVVSRWPAQMAVLARKCDDDARYAERFEVYAGGLELSNAFAAKEIVFQKYDYPDPSSAPTPAHQDLLKLPGFEGFPTLVVADGDGRILGMRAGYGGGDYLEWIRSL